MSIEFGLEELGAVRGQIIGVHELLARSFVCSLEERRRTEKFFNIPVEEVFI